MRPLFLRILLPPTALLLAPFPSTSGVALQEGPDTTPTVSVTTRAANKKLIAQMQGAWRLVDMHLVEQKTPRVPESALEHVGYCLISDNFLSIELHIGILGGNSQTVARSFTSGMHRFELDASSQMQTSTVIGTSTDIDGRPVFEPPNTKRHYRVEIAGNSLTLRRDDGHTLMFERLLDDRSGHDVYGRPIPEKKEEGKVEPKDGKAREGGASEGEKKDGE